MKTFMTGMCVLAASACVSVMAWASGSAADGKYVAHGPAATVELEAGLYKLDSSYARGVWPSQQIVNAGISKDDIPQRQRNAVYMYAKRVLAKRYLPTPDASVRGVRHIYDNADAILLWEKVDLEGDVNLEITATTTTLTVGFTSPKAFNRSSTDVTKQAILNEIGAMLNVPQEQLAKGSIDIAISNAGGTAVANGTICIPSPEDAGEGLMGFRWYNKIAFWTVKGKLFVSVVPFEGAVAQPLEITLEGK